MINRKYILSFCLCCTMVVLAGCVETRELTEEQQDVIAEYAAGVVLQQEDGYSRRLVKQDVAPETTPAPTAVPQATPEPDSDETMPEGTEAEDTTKEVALNDLYQVAGMETVYKSYSVCHEYTNEIYAAKGECLYVVSFLVKNTTSKSLKVDLSQRGIGYVLEIDGGTYEAPMSLLKNGGMNFLRATLKPNSSEKAVIIFNVPETAKNAANPVLTVQDGDRKAVVPLKR